MATFMKWITIGLALVRLLPLIISTVVEIEKRFKAKGISYEKLMMVRMHLEAFYDAVNKGKLLFEDLWPALNQTIKIIVSVLHTFGVFKK